MVYGIKKLEGRSWYSRLSRFPRFSPIASCRFLASLDFSPPTHSPPLLTRYSDYRGRLWIASAVQEPDTVTIATVEMQYTGKEITNTYYNVC